MKYLHRHFTAKKGHVVQVAFDKPARVLLLTEPDYKNYQHGKTFKYRGGLVNESPAVFDIPQDGRWHVVVELGSYYKPQSITASVSIQRT